MLMAGDKFVIAIMSEEQTKSLWLPIIPIIRKIDPVRISDISDDAKIGDYYETATECSYYIHEFNYDYAVSKTDPNYAGAEKYSFTEKAHNAFWLEQRSAHLVHNAAKQIVGGYVSFIVHFGKKRNGTFQLELRGQLSVFAHNILAPTHKSRYEKST